MENQKIINLLDNTPNQPSKFKIKNWVKIYNDAQEIYNTNSQIKFITSMLKSGLYGYSGAHILLSGTIQSQTQEQKHPQIIEKIY